MIYGVVETFENVLASVIVFDGRKLVGRGDGGDWFEIVGHVR